jgi:RHS repeat-associated protein
LSVAGPIIASTAAVTGSAKIAETASPSTPAQPTTSTIGYSCNGLGQISGVTYADGHAVSRAYDPTGRLSSVTDWNGNTIQFRYDGDGNLVSTTYPGGVVDTTTPDAADRPATITTARSGTTLAKFGYTYTPGGLLASTTDSLTGQSPQTFGHNSLTQLTDVGGQPAAYSYDAGDNITTLDDGTTLTYDPANQLTGLTKPGAQTVTFGYDQVGDRTTQTGGASATYGYDQARRLVSAQTGSGSATYAYNGDGLRVGEKTTASQVGFTWDDNSTLPMLLSDATNDYIYGPTDTPVEQVDRTTGNAVFLHADRLGSVRALTDTTGALVGTSSYGPYGAAIAHTGITTPFGYTGQYTDATGLIYLRARYYDPTTAQFLSVDPAYSKIRTRYAYAKGDPLDSTDPSGADPCSATGGGGCSHDGYDPGEVGGTTCAAGYKVAESHLGPICIPWPYVDQPTTPERGDSSPCAESSPAYVAPAPVADDSFPGYVPPNQIDPRVKAIAQQNLGWYHTGWGPISWFENGGVKLSPELVASTTVEVVETIWMDSYGPGTPYDFSLDDSIDLIEGNDSASFWWYTKYVAGKISADTISSFVADSAIYGNPDTTAGKIMLSVVRTVYGGLAG